MTSLEMLLDTPTFQALGWALIHFIWQGAIVAILYAGLAALLRRRAANVRYSAACAAMLLMLAFPIATIFLAARSSTPALKDESISSPRPTSSPASAPGPQRESLAQMRSISESAGDFSDSDFSASAQALTFGLWAKERFASMMPWLVAMWLAGVLFLSLRFLGGLIVTERLKRREASPI